MDSPNGIEWQYTREREQYINTLNHTEVIYQIGNPHDPFDKHDEIKDYQNIILVRCDFLSEILPCNDLLERRTARGQVRRLRVDSKQPSRP
jgi:hypothetical protein